jgi:hypothetical protein
VRRRGALSKQQLDGVLNSKGLLSSVFTSRYHHPS